MGDGRMKQDLTKKAFSEALCRLARQKKLDDIRVNDICEECGLSKKAFYYHFKDKYDLAAHTVNKLQGEFLCDYLNSGDFFTDLEEGNPVLNKMDMRFIEYMQRIKCLWFEAYPQPLGANLTLKSTDYNEPDSVRYRAEFEGAKTILKNHLKEEGHFLEDYLLAIAAKNLCDLAQSFYDRWQYGSIPEEECRELVDLNRALVAFWVSHGTKRHGS